MSAKRSTDSIPIVYIPLACLMRYRSLDRIGSPYYLPDLDLEPKGLNSITLMEKEIVL